MSTLRHLNQSVASIFHKSYVSTTTEVPPQHDWRLSIIAFCSVITFAGQSSRRDEDIDLLVESYRTNTFTYTVILWLLNVILKDVYFETVALAYGAFEQCLLHYEAIFKEIDKKIGRSLLLRTCGVPLQQSAPIQHAMDDALFVFSLALDKEKTFLPTHMHMRMCHELHSGVHAYAYTGEG